MPPDRHDVGTEAMTKPHGDAPQGALPDIHVRGFCTCDDHNSEACRRIGHKPVIDPRCEKVRLAIRRYGLEQRTAELEAVYKILEGRELEFAAHQELRDERHRLRRELGKETE